MTWPYEDHFINTTKYNSQSLNFTIEHEFSRMLRINLARPSHNQIVLVILGVLASLAVREAKPNSRSVHRRVRRRGSLRLNSADPRLLLLLHITTCTGVTPPYARHGAFEPGRRSSPALRPTNRIWRRDVVPHQDPPDARRAREPTGRRAIEW